MIRRIFFAIALFIASAAPSVAATTTVPGPFAAQILGTPCVAAGVTTYYPGRPVILMLATDDSRGYNVTTQNPIAGQVPSISIDLYDLTSAGQPDYSRPIRSLAGIANGQSLPIGLQGAVYHLSPYGFACVTGGLLTGYGVIFEGDIR